MLWLLACASGTNYPAGLVGDRHDPRDDSAAADTSDGGDSAPDTSPDTSADTDTAGDTAEDTGDIQGDLCAPIVPETAQVVERDATLDGDGVVAWVCRGATLSAAGDDARLFVDDRAEVVVSGTGARAWVLGNGRVSVYGASTEVFAEEGADVYVDADNVVVTTCTTLTFTGGPPTGGC